ncbi:hypothetical protein DID88_006264 [Monilinia fructigena]|uniref:Uncharacterized protein n=1 Tax=Monilinia fructigena TaxID=38457 RepID=A0A395J3B4_9HELO|nr:hypothetical protein DID88_006264 [Monilinia fructigena]
MPTLANLPDYQAYLPKPSGPPYQQPVLKVPTDKMAPRNKGTNGGSFSSNAAAAPPAYEDIFPQNDMDLKRTSAEQAIADSIADEKCAQVFDQTETKSTSVTRAESSATTAQRKPMSMGTLRIGGKEVVTMEQQNQIQLLRQEKLKRVRSDRKLFSHLGMFSFPFYFAPPSTFQLASENFQTNGINQIPPPAHYDARYVPHSHPRHFGPAPLIFSLPLQVKIKIKGV